MKRFVTLFLIGLLAMSCRSTRKIGAAINRKDTTQTSVRPNSGHADTVAYINGVMDRIRANHINYTTFTAKVNIDYKDASNKNYNVNATLRMYKDSAIWISANAIFGVEAIRALITKDSVKILDKLDKVYTARSMKFLQDQLEMPLDLSTLQDLLVGNPIYLDSVSQYAHVPSQGTLNLLIVGTWFKHLLTLNETDMTVLHSKIDDVDPTDNRTADITYSDYETTKGVPFATNRQLFLSESKKLNIKLEFRQYDFGRDVSFPFSVPKNFKRN